jgi:hypothetical protein
VAVDVSVGASVGVELGAGVEVFTILMVLIGLISTGVEHETRRRNKKNMGRIRFMYELTHENVSLFS